MKNKNLIKILLLFLFIFGGGIVGYRQIEGWSWFDAFYMTVITLSTTGFAEIHPLSDAGRLFTTVLIVTGMGMVAYCATLIMSWLMRFNLATRRRIKMLKKIDGLTGHIIICGFGRMGRVICEEMEKAKHPFVIIEQGARLIEQLKQTNFLFLDADAADDETLLKAGITRAKSLVSMIDNDHDAIYLTLAARSLNPHIEIVCRCNDDRATKKIKMAGANKVVFPFKLSGQRVAHTIINPAVEAFVDVHGVHPDDKERLQLTDIIVTEKNRLKNMTLATCGITRRELIIVGIKKKDNSFIFSPQADYHFEEGDCLISLGTKENYESVVSKLC